MQIEEYPFMKLSGHLVVQLKDGLWVYDTGSPLSLGNEDARIGAARYRVAREVTLGDGKKLSAADLSTMLGQRVVGLLGNDILGRYDHFLDLGVGMLRLSTAGTAPVLGKVIPVEFQQGCPTIELQVNGKPVRAVFDTGAPNCLMAGGLLGENQVVGEAHDSHPEIGEYTVKIRGLREAPTAGGISLSRQWAELPKTIEEKFTRIGWGAIVGNQLIEDRQACYLPSRKILAVGRSTAERLWLSASIALGLFLASTSLLWPGIDKLAKWGAPEFIGLTSWMLILAGTACSFAIKPRCKMPENPGVEEKASAPESIAQDQSRTVETVEQAAKVTPGPSEVEALSEIISRLTRERDELAQSATSTEKILQQVAQLRALLDFNQQMRASGKMTVEAALDEAEMQIQSLMDYLDMTPYDIQVGTPFRSLPDDSYVVAGKTAPPDPASAATVRQVRSRAVACRQKDGSLRFILPAKIDIYT